MSKIQKKTLGSYLEPGLPLHKLTFKGDFYGDFYFIKRSTLTYSKKCYGTIVISTSKYSLRFV